MYFPCFSHSQKLPPLLNLMPVVDLGNLNPCMFRYNSCALKLTQMQFEEILSYEVQHLPRLVGHDHGKHLLAQVTSYRGHLLLGSNLNCLTAFYPQSFTPSINFLR